MSKKSILTICFLLSLFICTQPCFSQECPPPEDGPGGDHPDENVSVSNSINLNPYTLQTPDSISLLAGYYRDFITLSSSLKRANVYTDTQTATIDLLNASKILVIPTGGVFGMEGSTFFKEVLKEYVTSGGVIICFAQQHGYDFNILPRGNELTAYGWLEDQNCQSASVSVEVDHSMFSGLTTNLPNVNVDGYFSQWPTDSLVLLRRTKNVMPAMLMYPYGSGKVIVSSMYSDWAYGHGMASTDEIAIVRDFERR